MSSTPIEADKLKSLAFLFEFTKRTLLMKKQLNVQDGDEEFDFSAAHGNPNEEFIRVVEGINEIESLQSRQDTKYRALVVHGLNTKMLYRSASLRPSHRVP